MTRKDCMDRMGWTKSYNRAALVCLFEENGKNYEAAIDADTIILLAKNKQDYGLEIMKALNTAKVI